MSTEGPFDAVLAFSQGSALAAGFLLSQAKLHKPPFRCAVFISGQPPPYQYDIVRSVDGVDLGNIETGTEIGAITSPTVHIWGSNDDLDPGNPEALSELCTTERRSVVVHDGGMRYRVPETRMRSQILSMPLGRRLQRWIEVDLTTIDLPFSVYLRRKVVLIAKIQVRLMSC